MAHEISSAEQVEASKLKDNMIKCYWNNKEFPLRTEEHI